MPQQERTYTPTRRYDLQLKIKDKDYTSELYQLRLISSLNSPYQIFRMNLFVDADDIILERLFGKDPIKLNIRLLGDVEQVTEQVDFNLMYVKGSFQIDSRRAITTTRDQKERSTFTITAVSRSAFKTITYPVNEIYSNTTVRSIIEGLAGKAGANLQLDSQDINGESIDQVIVPHTTLKKAIDYVDRRFGIFNGAAICFCSFDNKLFVKNITSKVKMNQTFTVYQLCTDIDNQETIKKCNDGKNFYTYSTIDTNYSANAKLSVEAKKERYIMTPKDQLYYLLIKDVKDVSSQYGIIYQSNKVEVDDDALSNREKCFEDPCAYETSETFAIARISKSISNLSTVSVMLERNLPILNLMNIGEAVKLNSQIVEFTDLSGKYVLKTSDIGFHKERDWQTTCRLDLIRTNQTI
jgi:hypothetical protein